MFRSTNTQDEKGAFRLALGAWFGLFGGIVTIVIPLVAVLLSTYNPGGAFTFGTLFLQISGSLILAGSILFVLSFFLYRRGFSALRKVDSEFTVASFLCLLGTIGFLLVIASAVVLAGTATSVLQCAHGHPSHALACLESGQPLGAYTGLVGFVLAWVGGVGVVFGLWVAGSRLSNRTINWGAFLYLIFLFLVLVPLIELAVRLPGIVILLLVVPILTVAAPLLVLMGTMTEARARAA
jgi:uncharacterized membrane protein